jgi:hypothetical protein
MVNKNLKRLVIEAVDNQINDLDPPATADTLNRLIKAGYSKNIAKEKIAAVLLEDMYDALKYNTPLT